MNVSRRCASSPDSSSLRRSPSAGFVHPGFFLFTASVGLNLLRSALTRWCPMMTILRKAGVKSRDAAGRLLERRWAGTFQNAGCSSRIADRLKARRPTASDPAPSRTGSSASPDILACRRSQANVSKHLADQQARVLASRREAPASSPGGRPAAFTILLYGLRRSRAARAETEHQLLKRRLAARNCREDVLIFRRVRRRLVAAADQDPAAFRRRHLSGAHSAVRRKGTGGNTPPAAQG